MCDGGQRQETPTCRVNRQPGLARRNIAIYGDKIFAGTSSAQLLALDARTGQLVWEHQVIDPEPGYRYTSGPIIVRGKVIAGMTGCERYKNDVCFISAHDPDTGAELWRTSTVARPGDPGGDTWGDLRPVRPGLGPGLEKRPPGVSRDHAASARVRLGPAGVRPA